MKKFVLSASVILLFVFYLIYNHQTEPVILPSNNLTGLNNEQLPIINQPSQTLKPSGVVNNTGQAVAPNRQAGSGSGSMMGSGPMMGQYRDGQYTGQVVDAYYGNVQVKAIIAGGRLTDVQALDYPKDRGTSLRISQQAIPQLTAEAIKSQNAQVDVISGATQTSQGFQQSLATALAQAK